MDTAFEINLLASLLSAERFDLIRPSTFQDELIRVIADAAAGVFSRTGKPPDMPALARECADSLPPGRLREELQELLSKVRKAKPNIEYYLTRAKEYAAKSDLAEGLNQAQLLLSQDDESGCRSALIATLMRANGSEVNGDYLSTLEKRLERYLKADKEQNRAPSGIIEFDKVIRGGLGPGEIGMFVALPKGGKSTCLINIGRTALEKGKSVLHFSLENAKELVEERYDCSIAGMDMPTIRKKPKTFRKAIRTLMKNSKAKLMVEYHPAKTLTVGGILSAITARGKVDLVIVDYAALMRPSMKREQRRFDLIDIFENLRHVAGLLKIPIWTAHQSNRQGTGWNPETQERREDSIIDMENIAECFELAAICDVAVSINQTKRQKRMGEMRWHVFANRLGPAGDIVALKVNLNACRVDQVVEGELE